MIRAGLYAPGTDAALDEAVQLYPALDDFITFRAPSPEDSFALLAEALTPRPGKARGASNPVRNPPHQG